MLVEVTTVFKWFRSCQATLHMALCNYEKHWGNVYGLASTGAWRSLTLTLSPALLSWANSNPNPNPNPNPTRNPKT